MLKTIQKTWFTNVPWRLVAAAVLLGVLGLLAISHLAPPLSDRGAVSVRNNFVKQLVFFAAGLTAMGMLAAPSYYRWRPLAWWAFGGAIAALVGVLLFAPVVRGTRAWIPLGPFSIQPAEFAKLALIVVLARLLSFDQVRTRWRGVLAVMAVAAVPAALILKQPDMGSAAILVPVVLAMLVASGVPRRILITLAVIGIVAAPVGFVYGLKPYQRARIAAFIVPERVDPALRYQQEHSIHATASGGFMGTGVGASGEGYPFYIPDRHTDFIFSVIGEELGFMGCTLTLLLYVLLLYEMFRIGWRTQEPFGRLLCVGVAAMIWAQVVVNVGMTVGWMPVMGIPLPFLSYGGSSLLVLFMAVGLVASVSRHRVNSFLTSPRERYVI